MENSGEVVWKDGRAPRRRCNAKSSQTGLPCKRAPIEGGAVCGTHGGRAPHVKKAAMARLENASLLLAKELLGMATDEEMPPPVRLAAIRDALDRAGLSARNAVDVTVELKPYERVMQKWAEDAEIISTRQTFDASPPIVDGEVVGETDFSNGSTP
jgi:hypothetical protein